MQLSPFGRRPFPVGSTFRMATTEEMDKMYRWTRYVYDFSRKYYLLGRDPPAARDGSPARRPRARDRLRHPRAI